MKTLKEFLAAMVMLTVWLWFCVAIAPGQTNAPFNDPAPALVYPSFAINPGAAPAKPVANVISQGTNWGGITNTNVTPNAAVSIAWNDESLTDTNIAGYSVYYSTNPASFSHSIITTNWDHTNGNQAVINFTLDPRYEYYTAVVAFDFAGFESEQSQTLAFIANGWLVESIASNMASVSFQAYPSNTYYFYSGASATGPWNLRMKYTNAAGVQTFVESLKNGNRFYRVLK